MPFEDPTTTLPASAIEGEIIGSQLAADAIDGKVITGATIRTSATDPRVQLGGDTMTASNGGDKVVVRPTPEPRVEFWTSYGSAPVPASIRYSGLGGDTLLIDGPSGGPAPGGGTYAPGRIELESDGSVRVESPSSVAIGYSGTAGPTPRSRFTFQQTQTQVEGDVALLGGRLLTLTGEFSEEGAWAAPPTFTSYWKQSTNGLYQPIRVSRGTKRARLDGCAMVATSYTGEQIMFTLAAEYRPLKAHYYDVPNVLAGSPPQLGCRVSPDGTVTMWSSSALSVNAMYDFSRVEWPLD